ncbi:hypothetical protein [Limosilactobacillus rudii]|uniref:hypothetical protein n=1 Tax=Limosilactobacillus rudii TaxID=2759755 RepID=UPI001C71DC5A|nr:hypothetical protein [Limosilactobacillus rudii]MCD7134348.1 hypothetical protein [Limosilactobacillus rudii]
MLVAEQLQIDETIISLSFYGRKYYKNRTNYNTSKLGNDSNRMLAKRRNINNLRTARRCLNHLGGQLGISIFKYAEAKHFISTSNKVDYYITKKGEFVFNKFYDIKQSKITSCLDFSERNFHFGGILGNNILNFLLRNNLCILTPSRKIELCKAPSIIIHSVFYPIPNKLPE